jgi:hypothetical protein
MEQQACSFRVVPVCGPLQRSRAVGLNPVDVSALGQEGPYASLILCFDCIGESMVDRGGGHFCAGREQCQEADRS